MAMYTTVAEAFVPHVQARLGRPVSLAEVMGNAAMVCRIIFGSQPQLLDWEVLPPGELLFPRGKGSEDKKSSLNPDDVELIRISREREVWFETQRSLGDLKAYRGRVLGSRKVAYCVLIGRDNAVAVSSAYKNALYVVPVTGWEQTLSCPKVQARQAGAIRLYHAGNWRKRAAAYLK